MADASTRDVKVVLLGDTGVGKSSIVRRFVTEAFDRYSEPTIGASFMSKAMQVDGQSIKFQIWDTAGQEKYHSLAPMYYRGAAAAILVYDITRNGSFDTLRNWVKELQTNGPAGIVLSVVGNKCDLAEQRAVPIAGAQEYAQDMGAEFFETSAKADTNVRDVFQGIAARLPPPGGDGGREEDVELGARSGGGDGKGGCPC